MILLLNDTIYRFISVARVKNPSRALSARKLKLAGHCVRHGVKEDADSASVEVAGYLVLGAYSRETESRRAALHLF